MKENLKTSRYRNGGSIPNVTDNTTWGTLTTGAWSYPNNDLSNNDIYGKLYNWYSTQGDTLCPSGWHVPSDSDWNKLVKFLESGADTSYSLTGAQGSTAGGKMKSRGSTYWYQESIGTDNSSGFSALPGGYRNTDGMFNNVRNSAFFWSVTELNSLNAWYRSLDASNGIVYRYANCAVASNCKVVGLSVRCLKN